MDDINIALLIDADNVSPKYISGILSELSKYGKITIRRMYGDWSQDRLHSWMRCASSYSLTPVMQPNNTPGKNASDIGLIIDAMDILYTGDVQGFCLVSSDGDFNKLATRLREAGKTVIGMGEKKTPESFRVSCERFFFLDVINSTAGDDDPGLSSPAPSSSAAGYAKTKAARRKTAAGSSSGAAGSSVSSGTSGAYGASASAASGTTAASAAARKRSSAAASEEMYYVEDKAAISGISGPGGITVPVSAAASDLSEEYSADGEPLFTDKATIESAIVQMISDNTAEGKETGLGEIGSRLIKIFPDFDVRNYHFSKLSEYLKDFDSLKVENRDNAVWVSLNSSSDSEIEKQIRQIFAEHDTKDMYINTLHRELEARNPNLSASIKKSGVTRFSVYLNRMIPSVEVNGRHVILK